MFKNVLLVHKMSTYTYYLRKGAIFSATVRAADRERFLRTHRRHYQTLEEVESYLKNHGIRYRKIWRGRRFDYTPYDLVLTVGGDGTFLEAARNTACQPIFGINSDPGWSVGCYCQADHRSFRKLLSRIFDGQFRIVRLHRLSVRMKTQARSVLSLNDVLVCHRIPASMSRYRLIIGSAREEQRGSGIWLSTATGSTGAIRSSGGRVLGWTSAKWQYRPRELYRGLSSRYRMTGGLLFPRQSVRVVSLMKDGMIYVDGAHYGLPLITGEEVLIKPADTPLNFVKA